MIKHRSGLVAILAGLLAAALPAAATTAATETQATTCREVKVPFAIAGATGDIAGTLCTPPGARTIQVLVPGITYDRKYWSPPGLPPAYSYVDRANRAGYATLAIDRLATGSSWHPPAALTGYNQQVAAVHAVIEAVRSGALGRAYGRVALVGHSLGTLISFGVAARYPGVDAFVSTGGLHGDDFVYVATSLVPLLRPAPGEQPLYVTIPGQSHNVLVNASDTDPQNLQANASTLVAVDTAIDAATFAPSVLTPPLLNESRRINIPVLTIVGRLDPLFCHGNGLPGSGADCSSNQSVAAYERPYYGAGATLVARVVPNTSHCLNLERTAPSTFDQILAFLHRYLPA